MENIGKKKTRLPLEQCLFHITKKKWIDKQEKDGYND
jgi:hypothetical protein